MKIRVTIDAEAGTLLNQMAAESGVSIEDLAEVAIYNIIALWKIDRERVEADCHVSDFAYSNPLSDRKLGNDAH